MAAGSSAWPLLFCWLSKLDAVVCTTTADIDQCVPKLTTGAQEVTAIGVDFRRDCSKHDFETVVSAFPHRLTSSFVPQSYWVRAKAQRIEHRQTSLFIDNL
jgi:hypothetical protein